MKTRRKSRRNPSRSGSSAGVLGRLRQLEKRHAAAMGAINESVYDWDILEDSIHFSGDMERVLGLSPNALKSFKDWRERIHPEDLARYRESTVAHLKGVTERFECDYRYRALDGTWHWARTHGLAIRNRQGRAIRMIGSTGNITELKERERELVEQRAILESTLEQQQATTDILKATLSSPTGVEPVFQAVLTNASRLCEASFAGLFLYDGEFLRNVAHRSASVEFAQVLRGMRARPSRETTTRRCALERRPIHTADLLNDSEFSPPEPQRREGVRTALSVPMQREGALIGVITLWRAEVRPFTEKQIALVQTFADQAVIAIENVRLFNKTSEALEEQIATAETLRVVAQLPTDVQPVFDLIARNAAQMCGALFSCLYRFDGELIHLVAMHNLPAAAQEIARAMYPMRPDHTQLSGRVVLTCAVQRLEDVAQDRDYAKQVAIAGAWRRFLAVPMLREAKPLGVIGVGWADPGPIPERQVELLKTFADQAVIAIENVRLFNETKESLEQQKASGEVLGAISSSIADTAPVFDKILESCERLFAGRIVGLNLVGEDGMLHIGAFHGAHREEFERIFPVPPGLSIVERRVVHYPDAQHGEGVPAKTRQGCKAIGIKSAIFAPLLWEGRGVGVIFVGRDHVSSFSEKEIALLKTFADQAVIAIQNARLFREIHDKSRQLEIASRHKSEFLANMSHELRTPLNAIIGFTRIVMRHSREHIEPKQYENLEKILASGQHLLALINSILDLAKVEAGRVEVTPGEVGLSPVLESCVRTVEPLVKADVVTLVKEFDGALPQMYVDEEKLRQIVVNLLSNAAKFTSHGSICLQAHASNGSVAIAVSDTGIGIAPDKLDVIFEEFAQADASSTRVYGGTGLGLTIARRLARLMGGELTAESVLGSGSTFRLTLPQRYRAPA